MPTVEDIVSSIESLPRKRFVKLLENGLTRERLREIEEDSKSGRLDFLVEEALIPHLDRVSL